ncbi:MAG: hypothetical protein GTO18_16125 [Anaerolineales bacterium]|nr:hypothetical protein [Anaerolineales bacterium]
MSDQPVPNVAVSLITIHKVITRGLKVSLENISVFSQEGFTDSSTQEGFLNYVRSLSSVIQSHHLGEDDIAFPYFSDILPDAPIDLLVSQHQGMVPLLEKINAAIAMCEIEEGMKEGLNELESLLTNLNAMWQLHIAIEEEHFTIEKLGKLIPPEEHLSLIQQIAAYSQQQSGPDYLVVPFILYNLPPDVRGILANGMPPEVTEELVPNLWKDKWESMKPFLLD